MKKKIKDLTERDILKICVEQKSCSYCPLVVPRDTTCRLHIILSIKEYKRYDEYFEKEVEVDV